MAYSITGLNGTTIAAGGDYPRGSVKDAPSGTIVDRVFTSDEKQLFAKMMDVTGITPNDMPDNDANDYQLYRALELFISSYLNPVAQYLMSVNYDSSVVYILQGCETRSDDGYAFYNGEVYFVEGNGGPICGGANVFVLSIESTPASLPVRIMNIVCAPSGSGAADFDDVVYTYRTAANSVGTTAAVTVDFTHDQYLTFNNSSGPGNVITFDMTNARAGVEVIIGVGTVTIGHTLTFFSGGVIATGTSSLTAVNGTSWIIKMKLAGVTQDPAEVIIEVYNPD